MNEYDLIWINMENTSMIKWVKDLADWDGWIVLPESEGEDDADNE